MKTQNKHCSDYCNLVEETFVFLVKDFNYSLIETVNKEFYVRHTYRNRWKLRKIIIENQFFPGDYGFSITINNLWNKEDYFLHTCWLEEDKEADTLQKVKQKFFDSKEILNLIKGKSWEEYKKMLRKF